MTGLEKLEFAASQVSVMQQELKDLQPELIKTSAETEKLMIKIEQDTVEVEAKKEVSDTILVKIFKKTFMRLKMDPICNQNTWEDPDGVGVTGPHLENQKWL